MNNLFEKEKTGTSAVVPNIAEVMKKVYAKMTVGLLLTALASFLVLMNPTVMSFLLAHSLIVFGLLAAEIGLVIWISWKIDNDEMSDKKAKTLFYIYSILNGITMAPLLMMYTTASITMAFLITAGMFAVMSIIGYTTKKDLSSWGSFLLMALVGLIICMIVNIFLASSTFDFIISIAAVVIFIGLTVWDTQQIKKMTEASYMDNDKIATYGALSLYLDFINLFIHILSLLGNSK